MFWWIVATLCAFFIKGLCGFANTLVFTTILSFGNSNVNISPVELILGYPTNFILTCKERHSIKWGVCLPLALLVIAGSMPGVLLLKNTDTSVIKMIFGAFTVFMGIEMLLREFQIGTIKESKLLVAIIGVLSGVLCGLYGVGALLGAYISRVTKGSSEFKANICVVFFVENTFRIILYVLWGIITFDILKQVLILLPVMLVGLCLGMLSGKFLDENIVRRLVTLMLVLSGLALIWSNIA